MTELWVLHGLLGRGREWGPAVAGLGHAHTPDLLGHAHTPDLLGHGDAPALNADKVWPQYRAQLDALLPAKCVLAGHSMGGILALRYAAERPERVTRVILLEAGVQPNTPPSLAALGHWITDEWPARFASQTDAQDFLSRCGLHPSWIDNLNPDLSPGFDPSSCARAIAKLDCLSRVPALNALRCPLHLIVAADGLLEPSDIAAMRQHPACHAPIVIEGAGHDLHLDQPQAVAQALGTIIG